MITARPASTTAQMATAPAGRHQYHLLALRARQGKGHPYKDQQPCQQHPRHRQDRFQPPINPYSAPQIASQSLAFAREEMPPATVVLIYYDIIFGGNVRNREPDGKFY